MYIESLNKRRQNVSKFYNILLFLTVLILSPSLHEFTHIALLNLLKHYYKFEHGFNLMSGLYGTITIFTPINLFQSTILLLSGIGICFLASWLLFFLGKRITNPEISSVVNSISTGLYLDSIINLSSGDGTVLLQMWGLSYFSALLPIISLLLFGILLIRILHPNNRVPH